MPIDPIKVSQAVQGGLSPVCATCDRYWSARDKKIPGDQCLAVDGCGGPLSGDDFHEYSGPISDFSRWCFVCGEESKYAIQVNNRSRRVGVCPNHVEMLASIRPAHAPDVPANFLLRSKRGTLTVREIIGPEKPSLLKAIAEVEGYYASKGK